MKQSESGRRPASAPESSSSFEYVWRSPWVRAAVWSLLVAGIVTALVLLFPKYSFALTVGIVGFLLAYLLHPLVQLLQRIRIPRILAVLIVYLALLGFGVLGSILIGQIFAQLGNFVQNIPQVVEEAGETVSNVTSWFGNLASGFQNFMAGQVGFESAAGLNETIREQVANMLASAATGLSNSLRGLLSGGTDAIVEGATSIISGTAMAVFIILASAYFLYDFPRITSNFYRLVPVRWRGLYTDISGKADTAIGGYLRGQLLISLCMGLMIWIGLAILGVPLALSIGFVAGVFNLVPYLGPIVAAVPGILLALTISPLTALLAVGLFIIANQVDGNVLTPLILGRVVNIHPLTVLLAIMVGLSLFGLVGALLAVPIVSFIKVLFEEYVMTGSAYHSGPFRHRSARRLASVAEETDDNDDSQ